MAHRISAAQARYQQIRKVLNGCNPLTVKQRLRLWLACINSSLLYSLEAVGCSLKGLRKLYILTTRHLRAILKQPVHISHIISVAIWATAGLHPPEVQIALRMQRLREAKDPAYSCTGADLISNMEVYQQLTGLLAQHGVLQSRLEEERATNPVADSDHEPLIGVTCPHCDKTVPTPHALKIHIGLQHKDQQAAQPAPRVSFSAPQHAVDGMPTCRLCCRSFTKWRQLKLHMERRSCPKLGGSSFLLSPPTSDNHLMPGPTASSASTNPRPEVETSTVASSAKNEAYEPLISQSKFHARLANWEALLTCRDTKAQLSCRCVLCGMWVAAPKHMKQHYNKTHHSSHPDLLDATVALCQTFKRQFTRN